VQVERTGADLRDAGFIHAEDAKAYLLQLGFTERQIAIKTSERNDLEAPENIDLLSPTCEVRAIVTKQALQEGWDCPFAYVLCALAAGRNLSAMTQLVGRILRMPQTAKTGREALDACWVLCHDVRTGEVVGAIKKSLEGEGMGDLGVAVRSSGGNGDEGHQRVVPLQRRQPWRGVRLFVPTVTWVEGEGRRRPLVYESDVLNRVPWDRIDPAAFANDWAPDPRARGGGQFTLGLELLEGEHAAPKAAVSSVAQRVDRARIVRSLIDIAPNGWLVWQWVSAVMQRLLTQGWDEAALAGSAASLIERLRIDLEAARDQLAEDVFLTLLSAGQIEFRLRADATDYELPEAMQMQIDGAVQYVLREADLRPAQKSLLEPAVATGLNDFEVKVAGYLDERGALQWWHRNVAKSQVGLQGWKRHKVYPDFVFALTSAEGVDRMVLLETKGAYLAGEDTAYKQRLLSRLHGAYRDERLQVAGELALAGGGHTELVCDLVFDAGWRGALNSRYFGEPSVTEPHGA
jgi:type III restriction enzyme